MTKVLKVAGGDKNGIGFRFVETYFNLLKLENLKGVENVHPLPDAKLQFCEWSGRCLNGKQERESDQGWDESLMLDHEERTR
jgi:hypothetical protein